MELGIQHERKPIKSLTTFEDVKRFPKPKPKRNVVELPFDVIVSILTMLPSRHLQRMRSVCRSWSLLISDYHFIREYSKFRASVTKRPYILSLYFFSGWNYDFEQTFFLEGDDDHCESKMDLDLVGDDVCKISNSCDGLICVFGHNSTYLMNPSIQKVGALVRRSCRSKAAYVHSAGLGFDDSTGEYKVVLLFHCECEVYTVGSLHPPSCWKVIDRPPLELSCCTLPVFVNGAIHWTVDDDGYKVRPEIALSFDVKSEKFDIILHPGGSSRPPRSEVVELGGHLCLVCRHRDGLQMDIWVLKDYNNREWMKQYSIDLSVLIGLRSYHLWTMPVTIHNGKIVFCNRDGSRYYYDPQSKTSSLKRVHVWGGFMCELSHTESTAYTESIVWPMAGITAAPIDLF